MSAESENVQRAVASLQELASLESETLAAEINLLGLLRDRISPAARFADKIPHRFRKLKYKPESEAEQITYLTDGFPFTESGKHITALLVIDRYSTVGLDGASESDGTQGQYVGERLYLTHDRKWILAERIGAFSTEPNATNEWEASCRIIADRLLLERYSLDTITEGLFAATDRLWNRMSPRMDALKRRYDRVGQVSSALARLRVSPGSGTPPKLRKEGEGAAEGSPGAKLPGFIKQP